MPSLTAILASSLSALTLVPGPATAGTPDPPDGHDHIRLSVRSLHGTRRSPASRGRLLDGLASLRNARVVLAAPALACATRATVVAAVWLLSASLDLPSGLAVAILALLLVQQLIPQVVAGLVPLLGAGTARRQEAPVGTEFVR